MVLAVVIHRKWQRQPLGERLKPKPVRQELCPAASLPAPGLPHCLRPACLIGRPKDQEPDPACHEDRRNCEALGGGLFPVPREWPYTSCGTAQFDDGY